MVGDTAPGTAFVLVDPLLSMFDHISLWNLLDLINKMMTFKHGQTIVTYLGLNMVLRPVKMSSRSSSVSSEDDFSLKLSDEAGSVS